MFKRDFSASDAPKDGGLPTTCPASYMTTATDVYRKVSATATWLAAEQDCAQNAASATRYPNLPNGN
jgi:hypothetical protein